jgi:hypothetical protein
LSNPPGIRAFPTHALPLLLLAAALVCSPACWAQIRQPNPLRVAFERGEAIHYRIYYSGIPVGKALFEVKPEWHRHQGEPHYHLHAMGRSLSGWDMFFKVRDYYHSVVDTQTLQPLMAYRDVREGSYQAEERYFFMRDAPHTRGRPENPAPRQSRDWVRSFHIEESDTTDTSMWVPQRTFDIVSAIYFARGLDFSQAEPGDSFPLVVYLENEAFELGMKFLGREVLELNGHRYRCLVIKPELVAGRVFPGQDDMTVWVSDDRSKLPLRIKSKIFIGYIRADIREREGLKYPLESQLD